MEEEKKNTKPREHQKQTMLIPAPKGVKLHIKEITIPSP
jgi:hypothetical protein